MSDNVRICLIIINNEKSTVNQMDTTLLLYIYIINPCVKYDQYKN